MNLPNLNRDEAALLDGAIEGACVALAKDGEVLPLLLTMNGENELACMPLNGAPKGAVSGIIGQIKDIYPVVFICEAWLTHVEAKPDSAIGRAVREGVANAVIPAPKDNPDRQEAVMVQFFHHQRHIVLTAIMTRAAQGSPELGEWRVIDNSDPDARIHATNFSEPGARLAAGDIE